MGVFTNQEIITIDYLKNFFGENRMTGSIAMVRTNSKKTLDVSYQIASCVRKSKNFRGVKRDVVYNKPR